MTTTDPALCTNAPTTGFNTPVIANKLKNTAKEFLLARAGQDVAEELAKEENIAFQIPEELLRDAGIPMDADLDIVCQEGRIIILPSELVQGTEVPEELLAICRELGITEDKVNIILRTTEEGTDEKTGV